jgi:hypothetical protein
MTFILWEFHRGLNQVPRAIMHSMDKETLGLGPKQG